MLNKKISKFVLILVTVLLISGISYAYAAGNTVPTSKAGDGAEDITGYTITNVVYHLNAANPGNIDSVSFTLSDTAGSASIKLVAAGSTWYSCTITGGTSASCTTTGATVTSADELRVVAGN